MRVWISDAYCIGACARLTDSEVFESDGFGGIALDILRRCH